MRPCFRHNLKPSIVLTFGFKAGLCTHDVVSFLRQLLYLASVWVDFSLFIAVQDVAIAFDSLDHDVICNGLLTRGVHPTSVLATMRELTSIQGRITLPGAGTTKEFRFAKGGKQG
eukprot:10539963-Karenia_brevis.AAC.1